MTPDEVLRIPIDGGVLADLLSQVLENLWRDGDLFSHHGTAHPAGGWQWGVYAEMVRAGIVAGKVGEDDYCEDPDTDAADDLICAAIRHAFGVTRDDQPREKPGVLPW